MEFVEERSDVGRFRSFANADLSKITVPLVPATTYYVNIIIINIINNIFLSCRFNSYLGSVSWSSVYGKKIPYQGTSLIRIEKVGMVRGHVRMRMKTNQLGSKSKATLPRLLRL